MKHGLFNMIIRKSQLGVILSLSSSEGYIYGLYDNESVNTAHNVGEQDPTCGHVTLPH